MTVFREGTGTRWLLSGAGAVLVLVGLTLAAVLALSLGQPSPALATHSTDAKQTAGDASVSPDDICKEGITGEWHFVINQVKASAPASIEVTFDDGHSHPVNLDPGTGSPTAKYTLTSHLTNTLLEATAVIYHGWDGQFNVSHTPCAPTSTATPTATPTAMPTATTTATPTATSTATPTATPPVLAATPAPTATPTPTLGVLGFPPTGSLGALAEDNANLIPLALIIGLGLIAGSAWIIWSSRRGHGS